MWRLLAFAAEVCCCHLSTQDPKKCKWQQKGAFFRSRNAMVRSLIAKRPQKHTEDHSSRMTEE